MAAAADSPEVQGLTAKGRATRERILRSAAQVLLSQGLSGFNMERVRQEASVSGSQLTHYFADKPALIRAVLDRQIEVVLDFHRQPSLGGLDTFDDFERWIEQNMRYLRQIGYTKTPTYHTLAGQLAKSDDATRETLADGYWRWVDLLERSMQRMKDRGVLVTSVDPRQLAFVVVGGHQGAGTLTFAYRQEWPLADALRFVVNYLRSFAADPAERIARKPRARQAGPHPPGHRVRTNDVIAFHTSRRCTCVADALRLLVGSSSRTKPVFGRRDRYVTNWNDGGQSDTVAAMGVDVIRGHARLAGPRRIAIATADNRLRTIMARHAVAICNVSTAAYAFEEATSMLRVTLEHNDLACLQRVHSQCGFHELELPDSSPGRRSRWWGPDPDGRIHSGLWQQWRAGAVHDYDHHHDYNDDDAAIERRAAVPDGEGHQSHRRQLVLAPDSGAARAHRAARRPPQQLTHFHGCSR